MLLIFLAIDFIWLRSSIGKLTEDKFVGSLGITLTKFASKNPYPWFKDFLQNVAIPNAKTFGVLTMWGEFLTAIALTISVLYLLFSKKNNQLITVLLIVGLIGGMLLNATFWLASGWTSASTDGLNLLMFLIQTIGLFFALKLLKA